VKKNNAVAVWLYAPGLIAENGIGPENMQALTGMAFKMTDTAADLRMRIVNPDGPVGQMTSGFAVYPNVRPWFEVADPAARIIGTVNGRPALAIRDCGGWRSVYSLTPLTSDLLREICDYAGVHVYARANDVFAANRGFIMLHTASAGAKEIKLPGAYQVAELLSGREIGNGVSVIQETLPAQATRIYQLTKGS